MIINNNTALVNIGIYHIILLQFAPTFENIFTNDQKNQLSNQNIYATFWIFNNNNVIITKNNHIFNTLDTIRILQKELKIILQILIKLLYLYMVL